MPTPLETAMQAAALAEEQYRCASSTCLPAARRAVIAANKAVAHSADPSDRNSRSASTPADETWTDDELAAANAILRRHGTPTISKEDTSVWYTQDPTCRKMVFYATPACHWLPAISEAASVRVRRMEREMGREKVRELFAPPFVVVLIMGSHMIMLVPECVADLQPFQGGLAKIPGEGMEGLLGIPAGMFSGRR